MGWRKDGTPDEEIAAWAARMIDSVEDFDYLETAEEWAAFIEEKGILADSPRAAQNQLSALERGRKMIIDLQSDIGVSYKQDKRGQYHTRDLRTGRFIKKDLGNERLANFRDLLELEEKAARERKNKGK